MSNPFRNVSRLSRMMTAGVGSAILFGCGAAPDTATQTEARGDGEQPASARAATAVAPASGTTLAVVQASPSTRDPSTRSSAESPPRLSHLSAESKRAPNQTATYPSYEGAAILQPEIVPVYWGSFTQSEINANQAFLAGFVAYLSGTLSPPGMEPTIAQYGVKGAKLYPTYYTDTSIPSNGGVSGHAPTPSAQTMEAVVTAAGGPASTPERVFLILTNGITFDGWPYGGQHFFDASTNPERRLALAPYGSTASDWERRISHELAETATDPDFGGWKVGNDGESEVCDNTPDGWGCDGQTVAVTYGSSTIYVNPAIDVIQSDKSPTCSAFTLEQQSQIEAVSRYGNTDLFALGEDHSMQHEGPATGGAWESLGGTFMNPPVAVAGLSGPGTLLVFAQGTDNSFYYKSWNGSAWSPSGASNFTKLADPGQLDQFIGQPAVAAYGLASDVAVFGMGLDGAYYVDASTNEGASWSGWQSVGGTFNGPPTVITNGLGIDLFGRGIDGSYYHRTFNSNGTFTPATGWQAVGTGTFISDPSVAGNPNGGTDIFGQGTDWSYYHFAPSGSGWAAVEAVGPAATFNGPPSAAWYSTSELVVVGQDTLSNYDYFTKLNGSWSGVTALNGSGNGAGAIVTPSSGLLNVFVDGTDHHPYGKALTSAGWSGWVGFGSALIH